MENLFVQFHSCRYRGLQPGLDLSRGLGGSTPAGRMAEPPPATCEKVQCGVINNPDAQ